MLATPLFDYSTDGNNVSISKIKNIKMCRGRGELTNNYLFIFKPSHGLMHDGWGS